MAERMYIAIDLKSFYASVECVERGLDPLDTNLVVADDSRTEKTICLAVSPSLKAYGISGRARLFEVVQKVKEINAARSMAAPRHRLAGKSHFAGELGKNPSLALDYIVARPQMAHYMKVSAKVYEVYLKYVAPEDIHVYSVDEVFMEVTQYLSAYRMSAKELAKTMVRDVLKTTGITATAGIGTNLYLAKIAMDIDAKHCAPDADGVRMSVLNEYSYRMRLWAHRPLTDFWRIGHGYAKKLESHGMYTMGDVARCSLVNEDLLYRLFGVNAELLIDHAWGYEPCTMADIKRYTPESNSLSTGQVLSVPYDFSKGRLIVREMTELLVLDLVDKGLMTDQMVLTVGYDIENLTDPYRRERYKGEITTDHYGRSVPKAAHGSIKLGRHTSSTRIIVDAVMDLYERIVSPELTVRRMYVIANHILREDCVPKTQAEQLSLLSPPDEKREQSERRQLERERRRQKTVLNIQKKFGKNAILKGMNLREGATTIERNGQVGGHKA